MPGTTLDIYYGENLSVLRTLATGSADLIYIDPPFNTGTRQTMERIRVTRDEAGDRVGFKGAAYRTEGVGRRSYADAFDDYLKFLGPRLDEARRILSPRGSILVHLDSREVHYVKVFMDSLFGRDNFMNEIIWAYDYGARPKSRWPAKHDTILWYVMDRSDYTFDYEAIDRIPYMAPGLVGPEKAERGKTPTDTWWHTIVPTAGAERTGYPTQKPMGILRRIVAVHSRPEDVVLDFFAGSGTTGDAALELGRSAILVDDNAEALEVMQRRLAKWQPTFHGWADGHGAGVDGT